MHHKYGIHEVESSSLFVEVMDRLGLQHEEVGVPSQVGYYIVQPGHSIELGVD